MIARHDVLAMRFSPEGDAQTYTPLSRIHMEYVDLSDRPDPLAAYRRLYSECMQRPFALENGDTCRVFLCRVGSRSASLFVIAHHLVLAGLSMRDRKRVVEGKSVAVRVDPSGCGINKKTNIK